MRKGNFMLQSVIPSVVVEVVATVSGVIISIGIPLIFSKLNKISKVHTTLFGIDDVDSVGGMVDEVETNSKEIEKNRDMIEEVIDKVDTLQRIVSSDKGEEE